MGQTLNRKYPYPETSDTPDVSRDVKALAVAVDTDMASFLPIGAVIAYAGATAPAGWLLCNGDSFNTETYGTLAAILGVGSTPNLTDRFVKGVASRPTTATGGSKKIGVDQLPPHNHPVTVDSGNATHSHGGATTTNGDHAHGLPLNQRTGVFAAGSSGTGSVYQSGGFNSHGGGTHAHYLSTDSQTAPHSHTASSSNTGGGGDYEPQFYAMLYIIKAV